MLYPRPAEGWVGDAIPFTPDGRLAQLYYLMDPRDPARPGMSWHLYETDDFAEFRDRGEALPHGGEGELDLNAYTGSVVADGETQHAFYTGFNPAGIDGEPRQLVMHASRSVGEAGWRKHPEHTFGAPEGYETFDFRDPYVFRPEADGPWHLLVIARRNHGASRRRGVVLDYVSTDLAEWRFNGEFWAPNRYIAVECPEVFKMGELWYFVYSEFSDRFTTRYRISDGPFGPWRMPAEDTVDGRALYAAKTVEVGGRRYFVGWIPTRKGDRDDGEWQWAGHLAAHEATQLADGSLAFGPPRALAAGFDQPREIAFEPVVGDWEIRDGDLAASAPDGLAVAVAPEAPDRFLLEATVDIAPGTVECGVVLRSSADGERGYLIRLEPRRGRLVFDRWPRRLTGSEQWQVSGDVPFAVELERAVELAPGPHRLRIFVDGTACVTYVDDRVAMSARMYDQRTGGIGLFVGEGEAAFTHLTLATRGQDSQGGES